MVAVIFKLAFKRKLLRGAYIGIKYNIVLSGPGFVVHVVDSGVGAMWVLLCGQAQTNINLTF